MLEFQGKYGWQHRNGLQKVLQTRASNPSTQSIKYLSIPRSAIGRDKQLQEQLEKLVPSLVLTEGVDITLIALQGLHRLTTGPYRLGYLWSRKETRSTADLAARQENNCAKNEADLQV